MPPRTRNRYVKLGESLGAGIDQLQRQMKKDQKKAKKAEKEKRAAAKLAAAKRAEEDKKAEEARKAAEAKQAKEFAKEQLAQARRCIEWCRAVVAPHQIPIQEWEWHWS